MAESQIITLSDFTGGIKNASQNPLAATENAVVDARNVEFLPNGGFRVRKGAVPVGYVDGASGGRVLKMAQVRFPLNETQSLLAQIAAKDVYAHAITPGFAEYIRGDAYISPHPGAYGPISDGSDATYVLGHGWVGFTVDTMNMPTDATNVTVRLTWRCKTPSTGHAGDGARPILLYLDQFDEYPIGAVKESADAWTTYTADINTNPRTGVAWTPTDINEVYVAGSYPGLDGIVWRWLFGIEFTADIDHYIYADADYPRNAELDIQILYSVGESGPTTGDTLITSGLTGDDIYARLNTVDEDDIEALTALLTTPPFSAGSDPMSVTTLGDRAVIAHPDHVPLVYGRCHEADASDWMYPKAVLWSQDGEHWEDITRYVCDPDTDTLAPIDRMRTYGKIAICTDMPNVDGFYFHMGTGNAGGDTEYLTAVTSVTFDEAADFTTENFQGAVVNWVQDAGATGHFEDGTATPLTLGPGNACPYIEAGMKVVKSGGYAYIAEIANNGEGSGEVTLDRTFVNAAVTGIYGLELGTATEGIKLTRAEGDTLDTAWTKTLTNSTDTAGYALRVIVSAAELLAAGTGIVTVEMTVTDGTIVRAYIVERDGTSADGATTPTQLYFKNATTDLYTDTSLRSPAGTTTSTARTWGPYAIDIAKDYLINVDVLKYAHYAGAGPVVYTGQAVNPAYIAWEKQKIAMWPPPPQTITVYP